MLGILNSIVRHGVDAPTDSNLGKETSMTIYTLYVKTNLKTNLKYLGYTKQNPYEYSGSGIHWNRHTTKHGKDIWTNIIFQSEIKDDIKKYGIYYSHLWNVVESDEWANLVPETGEGCGQFGEKNGIYGKKRPEITKKANEASIAKTKGKTYEEIYGPIKAAEIKRQRSFSLRKPKSPKHAEKCRENAKKGGIKRWEKRRDEKETI